MVHRVYPCLELVLYGYLYENFRELEPGVDSMEVRKQWSRENIQAVLLAPHTLCASTPWKVALHLPASHLNSLGNLEERE